ncbi:MAG: response regulator [Ramlibacter sp.]
MPIRVFLVEDSRHMRDVIQDLLQSLGDFKVVGDASTEAEANLWLSEHPAQWDLAVIDLVLDQGSGLGVLPRCKPRPPTSQVVVFSDYVTPGIHRHCLALGADAAISKADLQEFVRYCSAMAAGA